MRNRLFGLTGVLGAMLVFPSMLSAQTVAQQGAAKPHQPKMAAHMPDLSGLWAPRPDGIRINTWDSSDPFGQKPELAPMAPWAAAKWKDARPPFGAKQTFDGINDPVQRYCDPPGVTRIWMYPWEFTMIQTPKMALTTRPGSITQAIRIPTPCMLSSACGTWTLTRWSLLSQLRTRRPIRSPSAEGNILCRLRRPCRKRFAPIQSLIRFRRLSSTPPPSHPANSPTAGYCANFMLMSSIYRGLHVQPTPYVTPVGVYWSSSAHFPTAPAVGYVVSSLRDSRQN